MLRAAGRLYARAHLAPDIAKSVDIEDDRSFTFHLRPGHKWSDGAPSPLRISATGTRTSRSTRRSRLGPAARAPGRRREADGRVHRRRDDPLQLVEAQPVFLPALAGRRRSNLYQPAHYLKQFTRNTPTRKSAGGAGEKRGQRNWAALYNSSTTLSQRQSHLPSLEPWVLATKPPPTAHLRAQSLFHRIDSAGHQLPYFDRVVMNIAAAGLIRPRPAPATARCRRAICASTLHLPQGAEKRNDYTVQAVAHRAGQPARALYPNLTTTTRCGAACRDVRFRRRLSLAVDRTRSTRRSITASPGGRTRCCRNRRSTAALREQWPKFDIKQANAPARRARLTKRDGDGTPCCPTAPLQIMSRRRRIVEESDVLELVRDTWSEAGISCSPSPRSSTSSATASSPARR